MRSPRLTPNLSMAHGANGRIAFHSSRDGDYEIFVMNADGSDETQVTTNAEHDFDPVWSNDGRYLAFVTYGGEFPSGALRIVDVRDGAVHEVIRGGDGVFIGNPAWSPDGRRIAFTSNRDGQGIFLVNPDGTGLERVPDTADAGRVCAWSPNGRQLSFIGYSDGDGEIFVIGVDGSGRTRLTDNAVSDEGDHAGWSPDGRFFVLSSARDGGDLDVFVMNTDGSGVRQVTFNDATDDDPVWSPDGSRIAFHSTRDGPEEVYVVNADGTGATRLTRSAGEWTGGAVPAWAPGTGAPQR